jgi:transposase
MAQGQRVPDIAKIVDYSAGWVRAIVRRYNAEGPEALGDQRHQNPGRERLLSAEQEQELRTEVETGLAEGEYWTGPQLAHRMGQILGRDVHPSRGWELMKRWGLRQRVPRPQHVKADAEAQTAFKKRSPKVGPTSN